MNKRGNLISTQEDDCNNCDCLSMANYILCLKTKRQCVFGEFDAGSDRNVELDCSTLTAWNLGQGEIGRVE